MKSFLHVENKQSGKFLIQEAYSPSTDCCGNHNRRKRNRDVACVIKRFSNFCGDSAPLPLFVWNQLNFHKK